MRVSFKNSLFSILICFTLNSVAQKRLLNQLDSNWNYSNPYLAQYNAEEFENSQLSSELIIPENLDNVLLSAAIFFKINKERKKRRKETFSYNVKLDGIANTYINYYKRFRFSRSVKNYFRLKRVLNKVHKYVHLDFSYKEGYTCLTPTVDYRKGSFFYNEEIGTSEVDLYFGKNEKNDTSFVAKPIELISYDALAEKILKELKKGKSGAFLSLKAYDLIAIRTLNVKKSRFKKKIPKVKVIYLLGAYQNKFVNELELITD